MASLSVLVSSAVVAAVIAGLVSLRSTARTIQAEYVTKERGKWRDRVRSLALKVHKAAAVGDTACLSELLLELTLFLNPRDSMDAEILDLVRNLVAMKASEPPPPQFGERIALLLKHDWDRAKREAQPFLWSWPKKRMPYDEFECAERRRKNLATVTI